MQSKTIPLSKIKNINLIELNCSNGKYKLWGLDLKFIYYHLDKNRSKKSYAIIIEEEGNFLTIGITPEEPKKCFKVLKYLLSQNKDNKKCPQLDIKEEE